MSLVNRMLRDLDRRQAADAAPADMPPGQVRAVPRSPAGHEWFWRIVAALLLVSVAWVLWVTYQLQPRPALATPHAFAAADEAKRRPLESPPEPVAKVAAQPEALQQAAAVASPPPAPLEFMKLAQLIETPIPDNPAPAPKAKSSAPRPASGPVSLTPPTSLSKRNRPRTADTDAESLFREGVGMLNQGRVTEAQQDFVAALKRYPAHEPARQALVSILIDRSQLDEARRLLEEGLALNPAQAQFAMVLARIHVEQRNYATAADVLNASREAGREDPDYQLLRGAVLQRLGRHAEAAEALLTAVELKKQPAATWVALGVSLEATGKKPQAIEAYRRSLAAAPSNQETRSYAEMRIRALR
jgi:MSHA biogenesis protein MshN